MISAGDFRNGVTLEIEGQVVQILEFQHVKPGKGAAFVRTKLKNVINGGVVERTFIAPAIGRSIDDLVVAALPLQLLDAQKNRLGYSVSNYRNGFDNHIWGFIYNLISNKSYSYT